MKRKRRKRFKWERNRPVVSRSIDDHYTAWREWVDWLWSFKNCRSHPELRRAKFWRDVL